MTYDSEFERRLQEFAEAQSGLMVGDTFVVEGVTYRVTAHDSSGTFHFEEYPNPSAEPLPSLGNVAYSGGYIPGRVL